MCVVAANSCLTLCDSLNCSPPGFSVHEDSPGNNTGMGCHALFQGTYLPNPGIELCLPHCRQILLPLSHQGCPRIPEWVAYLFSRGSFRPRYQIRISCIAGGFFLQGSPKKVLEDAEEGGSKHLGVRKSGKSVELKWVLKDEQGSVIQVRRLLCSGSS